MTQQFNEFIETLWQNLQPTYAILDATPERTLWSSKHLCVTLCYFYTPTMNKQLTLPIETMYWPRSLATLAYSHDERCNFGKPTCSAEQECGVRTLQESREWGGVGEQPVVTGNAVVRTQQHTRRATAPLPSLQLPPVPTTEWTRNRIMHECALDFFYHGTVVKRLYVFHNGIFWQFLLKYF